MHFLLILLLVLFGIVALFFAALHLGFRNPKNKEKKMPDELGIPYEKVLIPTVSNKQLYGWFLPVTDSPETMIILHGWGSNNEYMLPLAIPFFKAGMNVLLVDSRGHGHSDSDTFSSLPRFAEDVGKAADWLKANKQKASKKIVLLGHSVGAGAVLFEASKRDDIDAVISVSAFAHPEWMMTRFLTGFHLPLFIVKFILRYIEWVISHSFEKIAPLNTVCDISSPILIVHGIDDKVVPIDDARAIIKNCPRNHIELFEVDDAGHASVDKFEEHYHVLISFLQKSGFNLLASSNPT